MALIDGIMGEELGHRRVNHVGDQEEEGVVEIHSLCMVGWLPSIPEEECEAGQVALLGCTRPPHVVYFLGTADPAAVGSTDGVARAVLALGMLLIC